MRPGTVYDQDAARVVVWPIVVLLATVFAVLFVVIPGHQPPPAASIADPTVFGATPLTATGAGTVIQLTVDGPLTPRMIAPTGLDDGLAGITAALTIGPMNDGHGGQFTAGCTATPLRGTALVITAAHCVIHADRRTRVDVDFAGRSWDGRVVAVNPIWHGDAADDVAVVVVDPQPDGTGTLVDIGDVGGAGLGASAELPPGPLVVIGRQLVADDGAVIDPLTDPEAATAATEQPAACTILRTQVVVNGDGSLDVPCGLLPGASGGPALVRTSGGWLLVGVVSSLVKERWANQLSSVDALHTIVDDIDAGDPSVDFVQLAR